MVVSSGVLIKQGKYYFFNKTGLQNRYDLPKGKIEDGETPLEACVRETMEESGIDLVPYLDKIKDRGEHTYIKGKRLHLFTLKLPKNTINIDNCFCSTTFERFGKEFPEVDGYRWFKKDNIERHISPNLYKVIKPHLYI